MPASDLAANIHATCVALEGRAALIRGPSGSGKSDLALRAISLQSAPGWPGPARLVADDRVQLTRVGGGLVAHCPAAIAGLIEVRGVGVIEAPWVPEAQVALVVDLVEALQVERFPDGAGGSGDRVVLLGVDLPFVRLAAFEATSHLKLLFALARTGVASAP